MKTYLQFKKKSLVKWTRAASQLHGLEELNFVNMVIYSNLLKDSMQIPLLL